VVGLEGWAYGDVLFDALIERHRLCTRGHCPAVPERLARKRGALADSGIPPVLRSVPEVPDGEARRPRRDRGLVGEPRHCEEERLSLIAELKLRVSRQVVSQEVDQR